MTISSETDKREFWQGRLKEYLEHQHVDRGYKVDTIATKRSVLGRWITYALGYGHSPELFDSSSLKGFFGQPRMALAQNPQHRVFPCQGVVQTLGRGHHRHVRRPRQPVGGRTP